MSTRAVVVGGGVIGLSVAWRLAERGVSVTVIDPSPGAGASWVAAGMLAPVAESVHGEESLVPLSLASAARWARFAADLRAASGCDPGYSTHGTVVVARDGDDLGELDDLARLHTAAGLTSERLGSREVRRREPALGSTVRGGLWLPEDHQVDNRLLLAALLAATARLGVAFVADRVTEISNQVVVSSSGSRHHSDIVVVATGAQPPPIDDLSVPVRPVKGQIVRVHRTGGAVFPTRTVRGIDVYIVPRESGEIAIGATSEEKGFDPTVTAGAVLQLLRDAWELVPGLAEAAFVEAVAGFRPGTPDNLPLLGAVTPGGPILATGHYRHGVLLAPVTADAVADLALGESTPDLALLAPFSPQRAAIQAPVGSP